MSTYTRLAQIEKCFSYHNNDKVKPTPGIGEVFDKSKSQPFDTHFKEEDHRENPVHIIQDILKDRSIFEMYIFQSLKIVKVMVTLSENNVFEIDSLNYQSKTGYQNHGDDSCFEILVLNQSESQLSLDTFVGNLSSVDGRVGKTSRRIKLQCNNQVTRLLLI